MALSKQPKRTATAASKAGSVAKASATTKTTAASKTVTAKKAVAKAKPVKAKPAATHPIATAKTKTSTTAAATTKATRSKVVGKETANSKSSSTKSARSKLDHSSATSTDTLLQTALASLKQRSSKSVREGMARFNIPNEHALGVKMGDIQTVGKQLGRHHPLAEALWQTGIYEARMLSAYVAEPEKVTPAEMDRWCRAFDNWAHCDTLCFALWDRTPHAWKKAEQWAKKTPEFQKRAGFALFWCLSVHDKAAADAHFLKGLKLIEAAANDDRHFVKKAVNMALRAIGKRNKVLNAEAIAVATRLAASQDATARWIGKDALREIAGAAVKKRLSNKT